MLNRRKPLRRTPFRKPTKLAKRQSYLRKVSGKKRREIQETRDERKAFRNEMAVCCNCRVKRATDVHEIVGASQRAKTVRERWSWLPACRDCHTNILQHMPKVQQLVLKRCVDPDHYDLKKFNTAYRNENSTAVTEDEVDAAEREMG